MKATHTTIYTADDGTIEFEEARDALAAPLPVPAGNTMKLWLLRPA